jgi:hypothetical protein
MAASSISTPRSIPTSASVSARATPALERLLGALLGLIWLVDGALQLQSALFGHALIDAAIAPSKDGQPAFMVSVIDFGIRVLEVNLTVANALSAGIELAIGALLLAPVNQRARRLALWGSIAWALLVWVFGEGAGALLTGSASFFTGAPGAALLYLILAAILLLPEARPRLWLPRLAGVAFLLGAGLNALPSFWNADGQSALWDASASDPRGVIAYPGNKLAAWAPAPVATNLIVIAALLGLGALLLLRPSRPLGAIALVMLAAVWWISQDFGGVLTFPHGTATDPNSAPLLALMILPLLIAAPSTAAARRPGLPEPFGNPRLRPLHHDASQ